MLYLTTEFFRDWSVIRGSFVMVVLEFIWTELDRSFIFIWYFTPFFIDIPKENSKAKRNKDGLKEKIKSRARVKVPYHLTSSVYTSLSHLSPETDCCASFCARSSINWKTDQVYGSIQFAPLLYFHDL